MKGIGLLLVALTLAGLAACGSNSTATNKGKCGGNACSTVCGGCGGTCGGDIAAKYDNVAMVFFHSDN